METNHQSTRFRARFHKWNWWKHVLKWMINVRHALPQHWIFSGSCRQKNECFLLQVAKQPISVLLDPMKGNIKEISAIYLDCLDRNFYCTTLK